MASIGLSTVAFAWMVTQGTWNFLQRTDFSNFYDVQGRAILAGKLSMPPSVLWIEGITIHGRTYMYYGVFPALLRIPVLLVTHRLDGRMTQPSLVLAFVVALVCTARLCGKARSLVRGSAPVTVREALFGALLVLIVGLGTTFLYLGSTALVYEEAELWGAALTLATFDALAGFIVRPTGWKVAAIGVLATLAMLTRGSVAAGAMVSICLVAAVYLLAWGADHLGTLSRAGRGAAALVRASGVRVGDQVGRRAAELLGAVAVPAVAYIAINEARFDTPFSVPFNRQLLSAVSPHRKAVLAANGGSLFGLKFLPTNLLAYVRPDALVTTSIFPWLSFPARDTVIGHLLYDTLGRTSSVPASMPVLFIASLIGLYAVFRPLRGWTISAAGAPAGEAMPPDRRIPAGRTAAGGGLAAFRVLVIGGAAGTLGVLIIAFITERYLADVIPLVVICSVAGWQVIAQRLPRLGRPLRIAFVAVLAVLVLLELWANFSLALLYQRAFGNDATMGSRAGLVAFEERLHTDLVVPPEPTAQIQQALPSAASPLQLAVLRSCRTGLFQYDGTQWEPVEIGSAGGSVRLAATFPRTHRGQPQPLVVSGSGPTLQAAALTWLGGDRYQVGWLESGRSAFLSGDPFTADPHQVHQVVVDLNAATSQILVFVDGAQVFAEGAFYNHILPLTPLRVGSAPTGAPMTARFDGILQRLPVRTPICDQLVGPSSRSTPGDGG